MEGINQDGEGGELGVAGARQEYADIVGSLKRRLIFMERSGIKNIGRTRPALAGIYKEVEGCTGCKLGEGGHLQGRVTGYGPAGAAIAFIHGRPFDRLGPDDGASVYSGPEGELLGKIIKSMGLELEAVYLGFAVKCRAADGGAVSAAPPLECVGLLSKELEAVRPKVIVALGPVASGAIFGSADISAMRGRLMALGATKGLATYSPREMLEDAALKKAVWADMKLCIKYLDSRIIGLGGAPIKPSA
jgi:DNA polymerase